MKKEKDRQSPTSKGLPALRAPVELPISSGRPEAGNETRKQVDSLLKDVAAPAAALYLANVMLGKEPASKLILDAAKTILDRAGFIAPKAEPLDTGKRKALQDMSTNELTDLLQDIHRLKVERCRPTIDAQDNAPEPPNPLSLLD